MKFNILKAIIFCLIFLPITISFADSTKDVELNRPLFAYSYVISSDIISIYYDVIAVTAVYSQCGEPELAKLLNIDSTNLSNYIQARIQHYDPKNNDANLKRAIHTCVINNLYCYQDGYKKAFSVFGDRSKICLDAKNRFSDFLKDKLKADNEINAYLKAHESK